MISMNYTQDILNNNFEQTTIILKNDYEGKATATLIRRLTENSKHIAILYIHGFNDYFFQQEMAYKFNDKGFNFYALDLRKYGRSYLPHQKFNDIRDIKSYYEEINRALEIIKEEGNKGVILMGHSTGGLIATLYAKDNTEQNKIAGLILNSPFFEFNMTSWVKKKLILPGSIIGKVLPNIKIAGALSHEYGESLHKDYHGEWDYNLNWKPHTPPPISLGWLRAIKRGHKELQSHLHITEPVLALHSTETITNKKDAIEMHTMDAVLSITDIKRVAQNIRGNIQTVAIEDGMHDLILSRKDVREHVYATMLKWMAQF